MFERLNRLWKRANSAKTAKADDSPDATSESPDPEGSTPPPTVEQAAEMGRQVDPTAYLGDDPEQHQQVVRNGFLDKARQFLSRMPLAQDTVAMYFTMLDAATPRWAKATAGAALAYFILPLDAVADVIPVVGFADDASVIAAALATIAGYITDDHRQQAQRWLEGQTDPAGTVEEVIDVTAPS